MRMQTTAVVMAASLSGLIPSAANAQDGAAAGKKTGVAGLIEYRAAALAAKGDAGRGRRLIEKADRTRCLACHAVAGRGPTLGPDLAGLGGGRVGVADILDAIL